MPRINHIAIRVDDLEAASGLYKSVFGFTHVNTIEHPGHISMHLTDGYLYLTLIKYESESAPEADFAGPGPGVHHFGIVVDDPRPYEAALKKYGCEVLSGSSDVMPVKFRPSAGVVAELLVSTSIGPKA